MKIKTKEGIAEGQSLSDIQEYNVRLKDNTIAIYIIGFSFIGLIIIVLLYIHYFNVINNIVANCVGT